MKNHYSEDMLIDYLDGLLTEEQRLKIEDQLEHSATMRKELDELRQVMQGMEAPLNFQPSIKLQNNFEHFLQKEKRALEGTPAKVISISSNKQWFIRATAAAIILFIGFFIGKNGTRPSSPDPIPRIATTEQLNDLRSEMMALLLKENSTSGRIKGVNISYDIPKSPNSDRQIVQTLIETMNTDKSTNVRLAAVEALFRFSDNPQVRTAFCEALRVQTNPIIQISIIDHLVKIKEQRAVNFFEELIENDKTIDHVKDKAQLGIFKMT